MSEQPGTYSVPGRVEIRPECFLVYDDDRYQAPTPEEVREALRRVSLTGAAAGRVLGVSGRAIRRWTGGESDIPYSAWRLLLLETGQAQLEFRKVADG